MGEDDIVELLWNSGQVVRSSQTQRPPSVPPPCIFRGNGSGNAPLPQPPPLQPPDQNLFICEDEMASWLDHHPLREDEFRSHLFYSGVVTIPFTQKQDSVFVTAPLPPLTSASDMYTPTAAETLMDQVIAARRAENFINFSRLKGNIYTGCRIEAAAPWVPVVGDSTQVGSNATPSSSANDSCLTPATVTGAVSQTFVVPSLSRKAMETVCEIVRPSSSRVSEAETEPIQVQPEMEAEAADERKRKEREQPAEDTKDSAKEACGSTSRKRKRAAAMILIEILFCFYFEQTDKASMLDDAIEYLKLLEMQIQNSEDSSSWKGYKVSWTKYANHISLYLETMIMSMGGGSMMPMMYTPNMQRFMPNTTMGMMGVNRPPFIPFPGTASPRPAPMAGLGPSCPAPPYPFPNIQAFDPSRAHLTSQQPDPVSNQPRFPGYLNPYGQFVGLQQMQQPPLQNQTTSQLSLSQASSSKEPEDQDNKQTG